MSDEATPGFPPEVRDVYELLRQEMAWLHRELKAYRDLFLKPDNHRTLRQTMPDLFRVIEHSLVTSIVVGLTRFTDQAQTGKFPNLTLPHLMEVLHEHGNAPALYDRCCTRVQPIMDELAVLKDFRNKVVAHRDRTIALRMEPAQLPMTVERIRWVCSELADTLNEIGDHFTGSVTDFETPVEVGDGDTLAHYLRRAVREFEEDDQRRHRGE